MENKNLEQRMETEPVHRVILSLAAPTVLSMLVISAYSIVDTFFVTRLGSRGRRHFCRRAVRELYFFR